MIELIYKQMEISKKFVHAALTSATNALQITIDPCTLTYVGPITIVSEHLTYINHELILATSL